MTGKTMISAKITRPTVFGAVQRERLFSLLDGKVEKSVVWVSAPAGSGKTTLVSSWLGSRGLPSIWYYCDEGDSDPATFFYYMGLAAKKAAPRKRKPLPLLTPEYLAGIATFTRRYIESLCDRLTSSRPSSPPTKGIGGVIVLDNYQDVPAGSPVHEMLATGFGVIRDGVSIVIISRDEPPPAFARLRANDRMNLLRSSDIRFTFDESRELVHGRNSKLDTECIRAMHEKAEGWAAGIILMLERGGFDGTRVSSAADFDYERVFDYFAGELFNRTRKEVRDFLLKTAFLPVLGVPLAEKLTGVGAAASILRTLSRNHFFTERLAGGGQEYQYHPLFRDFLLNRSKTAFSAAERAAVRRDAASLLEQTGRTEDAARLYGEAGDLEALPDRKQSCPGTAGAGKKQDRRGMAGRHPRRVGRQSVAPLLDRDVLVSDGHAPRETLFRKVSGIVQGHG
jgi:ATP/maltotriose-dependent transcriptional regulator MalT